MPTAAFRTGHSGSSAKVSKAVALPLLQLILAGLLLLPLLLLPAQQSFGQDRAEFILGRSPGGNMRWQVLNQQEPAGTIETFESGGHGWGGLRGVGALAMGDVDGDGLDEVALGRNDGPNMRWVVFDDAATVLRQIQSGGEGWGIGRGVSALAMGDLDGDGRDEMVIGRSPGPNMRWAIYRYNDATGRMEEFQSGGEGWGSGRGVAALAIGDIDGDGDEELAIGRSPGRNMRWALFRFNAATGRMEEFQSGGEGWGGLRGVSALTIGNIDGDAGSELIVGRSPGGNMRWAVYRYNSATERVEQIQSGGDGWGRSRGVTALAVGNLDNADGVELAIGRSPGVNMRWAIYRYNDATANLEQIQSGGAGWGIERGTGALAMGDVDGDDHDELAIGRSPGPNMRWAIYRYNSATDNVEQIESGGDGWGITRGVSALAAGQGGSQDQDGDGLLDHWELNGIDTNADGTVEFDLPTFGSDPLRRDLFVEVDCLVSDGNGNGSLLDAVDHSHCPNQAAIQDVVQGFADAPAANPDGTSGMQLHVDTGPLYGAGTVINVPGAAGANGNYGDMGGGGDQVAEAGNEIIDWDGATGDPGTNFYTLKQANFDPARRLVFRYAFFGHQTNARRASNDCTSGWAEGIPGNDFMVTLGGRRDVNDDGTADTVCWGSGIANNIDDDGDGAIDEDPPNGVDDDGDCTGDTDGDGTPCDRGDLGVDEDGGFSVGSREQQAGTFMHELGHTAGLRHGGIDHVNDKPNFLSVMNYAFQPCAVPNQPGILPGGCDYSRDELDTLSEPLPPGLDECVGIDGLYGLGPMQWDGDATFEGVTNCQPPNNANVTADINFDGDFTQLAGFDDWDNIRFDFRRQENFADGVSDPVRDEPDPETIERSQRNLSQRLRPAISVEKTTQSDSVGIGETVIYTLTVRNTGAGPALNVIVTDTLPDGTKEVFDLGTLIAGSEQLRTIEYFVSAETRSCTNLTNRVEVEFSDFVGKSFAESVVVETPVRARYEYAAKFVCGAQPDPADMRLARGFYATSINIHNPSCSEAVVFKKLALTIPPGSQKPGKVLPIATDVLKHDEAIAVDCMDVAERLFPKGLPASFIEGYLVIQSPQSLDVTALYSTATLDEKGQAADHSDMEVQRVPERILSVETGADLAIEKEAQVTHYSTGGVRVALVQYTIRVTNRGPASATNVVVEETLDLSGGLLGEFSESEMSVSHGGHWTVESHERSEAELRAEIPSLPASETATLELVATAVISYPGENDQSEEVLRNTATVSSVTDDPNEGNNSVSRDDEL